MYIPKCKVCRKNIALGRGENTCEELSCYRIWKIYLNTKKKYTIEQAKREIKDISEIVRMAENLKKQAVRLKEFVAIHRAVENSVKS